MSKEFESLSPVMLQPSCAGCTRTVRYGTCTRTSISNATPTNTAMKRMRSYYCSMECGRMFQLAVPIRCPYQPSLSAVHCTFDLSTMRNAQRNTGTCDCTALHSGGPNAVIHVQYSTV